MQNLPSAIVSNVGSKRPKPNITEEAINCREADLFAQPVQRQLAAIWWLNSKMKQVLFPRTSVIEHYSMSILCTLPVCAASEWAIGYHRSLLEFHKVGQHLSLSLSFIVYHLTANS